MRKAPTLDEIRAWPITIDVADAALALGVSRATAYGLIKRKEFLVDTIDVGGRIRVLTASLISVLEGN